MGEIEEVKRGLWERSDEMWVGAKERAITKEGCVVDGDSGT